jgi:hypothetical protein
MNAIQSLLSRLEALEAAATPGPVHASDPNTSHFEVTTELKEPLWFAECFNQADTELVAALRNSCKTLIAIVRVQGEALEHYDEWLFDVAEGDVARKALARAEALAKGE